MSNEKATKWKKCFMIAMSGVLSILALVIYFKVYSHLMWGKFPMAITEVSVDQAYDREVPGITDKILQLTNDSEIYTRENCIGGRTIKGFQSYYDASVTNNGNEQVSFVVVEQMDSTDDRVVFMPHTLAPGESFELQGLDELHRYLFLYYGEGDRNNVVENISDNQYMRQYKSSVIYLCIAVVVLSVLLVIGIFAGMDEKKISQYLLTAGWIFTAFGIFFYAIRISPYFSDLSLLGALVLVAFSALCRQFSGEREVLTLDSRVIAGLISGFLSLIISFGFFLLIITSKEGSILYSISPAYGKNILDYVILLFSFLLLYLILQNVLIKFYFKNSTRVIEVSHMQKQQVLGIVIVMIYLVRAHMTKYAQDPLGIICLFTVAACLILYNMSSQYITDRSQEDRRKAGRLVIILDIILAVVIFANITQINPYCLDAFDALHGAVHHWSAQFDTIISIFNRNPFDGNLDVHGHYAFFFMIPLLLFGRHIWVIAITYGLIAALTFVLTAFVINKNLKTDFLRIATTIMVFASMCAGDMQLVHRFVFVAVLLFIITCHKESNHQRWIIAGYIACILSLVWSTEVGLVTGVAWAVYMVLVRVRDIEKCFWVCIKHFCIQLVIVFAEIMIYSCIIMLYNGMVSSVETVDTEVSGVETADTAIGEPVIVGEEASSEITEEVDESDTGSGTETETNQTEVVFGVMANSGYMDYHTGKSMETGNLSGYYILIFFLALVAYEFYYLNLFGKTEKKDLEILTVLTVSGIGLYTYVVSHSINDPDACAIYLSLTICLLFGELLEAKKKKITLEKGDVIPADNILGNITYVFLLFSIGFVMAITFPRLAKLQRDLSENRLLDNDYFLQEARKFDELVPPGTAIYNKMSGLDEIYFELGREDIDLSVEEADYVISNVDLTGMGYHVEKEIYFGKYRYFLYQKE